MRDRYSTAFYLLKQGLMDERLSDLLWNIWARDAADSRDRLFAMLSLAGRSRGWSHGDYRRSVKQVFCGAPTELEDHDTRQIQNQPPYSSLMAKY
ncbi:heterokaryon incompatibility protein [Colletotrichum abscissum]|uniref:heterokaryon incompatibility protein n=1 Tax=Colletotrichum abscissum TaxID=1671311 RepID=UPI0027D745EB|nr:heterokaryon incompatibility protein [Colletotrichum abscissum]KAK1514610.1 heterokaryon incompatibility protein [Colletotrichum abscissum]